MRHLRPACSACVYWLPESGTSAPTAGHCHRFPPNVLVNHETGVVLQKFPTTDHHHWCGEWSGDDEALVQAARQSVLRSAHVGT